MTDRFRLRVVRGLALGAAVLFAAGTTDSLRAQQAAPTGIAVSSLDRTCKACDDFFGFADGGWVKANPIPPQYPSWGVLNVMSSNNQEVLRTILEQASLDTKAAPGSEEQQLGDFYGSCMDEPRIEAAGIGPIKPDLDRIDRLALPDLEAEVARLQSFGAGPIFRFGSQPDLKNSERIIAGVSQGGLGLPDRDYYTKTDARSQKIRDEYVQHMARMFALLGESETAAAADAKAVMGLETRLAEASMTRVERRDPDASYHPMTPAALQKLTPHFTWDRFIAATKAPSFTTINVGQPKFLEAVDQALADVPIATWRTYLRWRLIDDAAPALPAAFVKEDFDFNQGVLQGTKEMQPRWRRCVAATDRALGFALGKRFVEEKFPPEAKARADRMVRNLIAALGDDLETLPWMSPATRKAAIAKLDAFTPKIGYPDKWRDYSAYHVDRASYVVNVLQGRAFATRQNLDKIGKPVDRTEWGMTPQTVNAYYNPTRNEIVFPAGILQPPLFDAHADDAVNYGGMGAVIGHEMTHGFDDEGRKFDGKGDRRDWWTPEDAKNFLARAACVEKQFGGYVVEGDLHENGKLVLGESIADLGGLTIAYRAYHMALGGKTAPVIDGFTGDQRFFLAWAQAWASQARPQFERMQVTVNPHPLGRFRAIGPVSNMPEFAKAFDCQAGDPMVRAGEARCKIW
jgi:predicted metalloendopeptidase